MVRRLPHVEHRSVGQHLRREHPAIAAQVAYVLKAEVARFVGEPVETTVGVIWWDGECGLAIPFGCKNSIDKLVH